MTNDEIMALTPEQLRVEIAKKKDILPFPDDRCPVCGWPYAETIKNGCVPGNCSMRPVPKIRSDEDYPDWPNNIYYAFSLFEEARQDGYAVSIEFYNNWHVVFFKETGYDKENHEPIFKIHEADAETAPLAICRAWLMWKEAQG